MLKGGCYWQNTTAKGNIIQPGVLNVQYTCECNTWGNRKIKVRMPVWNDGWLSYWILSVHQPQKYP